MTEVDQIDQTRPNRPKCYANVTQQECNNNKY